MKQPDNHPFELIGERLRSDWREIETAQLPARITMLLEQLKRREASEQANRRPINVVDAAACLGHGEGLEKNGAPLAGRHGRRLVFAEV